MSRAVVFAYHNVGVRCLRALVESGFDVPLVLTHEDNPAESIWFDSVARTAARYGIATISPTDPNAAELVDRIGTLEPDFLFSFYYRSMLKLPLLGVAPRGALNMHGSLLPKYRGRVPINWAIIMARPRPVRHCTTWTRSRTAETSWRSRRCPSFRMTLRGKCSTR